MNEFFASVYELFYTQTQENFSDRLYDANIYGSLGIGTILISLAMMVLFYYLINSPRFNRPVHWLIFLAINFGICFVFGAFYPKSIIFESTDPFSIYAMLGMWNGILGTVYFFLFSMLLRRWSTNVSTAPFKSRYM